MPLKQIQSLYQFVATHPLTRDHKAAAMARVLRWQILSRIGQQKRIVPFAGTTRLAVARSMTGATGNIYAGLHEFRDMAFVTHLLRPDDTFFDVGANIGSYTILAAGVAGAKVVAFEPSAETFQHLNENVALNHLQARVRTIQNAVGAERGKVRFTVGHDTMNRMLDAGDARAERFVEVDVCPLDDFAEESPLVMKVDVEGFEKSVLSGAPRLLASSQLKAVLVEANESQELEGGVHQTLLANGFVVADYDPFTRALSPGQSAGGDLNGIYIRDIEFLQNRLREAPAFQVLKRSI